MDINKALQQEFSIQSWQVENTVKLIDEGNTIPFIARYRKEITGSLTDELLRDLYDRLSYLRNLEQKKDQVIATILEQGQLTDDLKLKINQAQTLVEVEDIYRPFRPKKKTRATVAKSRGLEPLAMYILLQQGNTSIDEEAKRCVDSEKEVLTIEDAIAGAQDIIAENIADDADYRKYIRAQSFEQGIIQSKAKKDQTASVFEMYYDYEENIKKVAPHRILAINRGEKEKILNVKVIVPEERLIQYLCLKVIKKPDSIYAKPISDAISDAYKRLIAPSIERDIRNELSEKAEEGAIEVFGKNLAQLLMQAPISGKVVLALDPAFRTGCKFAIITENGKVLDTGVVYPTEPHNKVIEAKAKLKPLMQKHKVQLIAIGNGTASRETEIFVAEMLKEIKEKIQYIIVNEAGASVYSASKLGTEEFPEFDVALRSAVSIGRRLQDPLAELVKIDPQSIGVGQYQHDMNQKRLAEALTGVVEDCVNKVGIDLNTASPSLLSYISGISKPIAKNIVAYRESVGVFKNRKELLKVPKLGPKAYEQCAGFLRIQGGKNILDQTGVHPESYDVTTKLLDKLGLSLEDIHERKVQISKKVSNFEAYAKELEIGIPTLTDIVKELDKPGRDPRDEMPAPILRVDVLDMKDLKEGMILKGTVRNVIDFGVFVDIGVHQDGLVHISHMTDRYIKHPLEVVSVGDVVEVQVMKVEIEKKRIGLTMKINSGKSIE
ncbi:MAG: RNA-binding transcriptional accessory protein [Firmicutes bacterium HGW-Firmicutes-5]|nr:MAG: RNA-binding transcriptional accessory protein [Firmicutes bacterium HGW-Firmicutes-5]